MSLFPLTNTRKLCVIDTQAEGIIYSPVVFKLLQKPEADPNVVPRCQLFPTERYLYDCPDPDVILYAQMVQQSGSGVDSVVDDEPEGWQVPPEGPVVTMATAWDIGV